MADFNIAVHCLGYNLGGVDLHKLYWGDGMRRGRLAYSLDLTRGLIERGLRPALCLGGGVVHEGGRIECLELQKLGIAALGGSPSRKLVMEAVLDQTSQNSREEILERLRWCAEKGVKTLYLVTSPFHMPRATKLALDLGRGSGVEMFFAACETDMDEGVSACVTAEPPHRGDDWQFQMAPGLRRHVLEARTEKIYFNKKAPFASEWDRLLKEWEA